MLEADHYRDAIAASKGEKFCQACHKAVMREARFCPYSGAACPTAELEEKAADVSEQAEEELDEAAEAEVTEVPETEGKEQAFFFMQKVVPAMEALRKPVDELEMIVNKNMWPMPSYGDLLFEV